MRQLRGKAWLVTLYFIVSDVLIGPGVFRVACSDPASDRSAWGRSGRVKNGELVNYRLRRANAPRTVMARHRDLSAEDLREWWNFVSRGKMMAKPRLADWKGMGIFAPFYLRESASFRRNRRAGPICPQRVRAYRNVTMRPRLEGITSDSRTSCVLRFPRQQLVGHVCCPVPRRAIRRS